MKPYSTDLRQRVLDAVDRGTSRSQIVELLEVSLSTIKRYLRQRRETGQLAAKPIPGRPPKKGAALDAELAAQLAAHDDATLEQHCQWWQASHGVQVSTASMSRAIARLGWTRKKRRWVPPSGTRLPARPGTTSPSTFQPSA
jgi:transposase